MTDTETCGHCNREVPEGAACSASQALDCDNRIGDPNTRYADERYDTDDEH